MNDFQLQDLFDRSFGVTASECADLLDWPGKTSKIAEEPVEALINGDRGEGEEREPVDWDEMNRFRGQVKLNVYLDELTSANPTINALKESRMVFLMRSAEQTKAIEDFDGGAGLVLVDALWFSFVSFVAQTMFVSYPPLDAPDAENKRLSVALHFGLRAKLYEKALAGEPIDETRFSSIWETWPSAWDADFQTVIFMWTALGRFVVAHELAHLHLHSGGGGSLERIGERGLTPPGVLQAGPLPGLDALTGEQIAPEIEADLAGLRLCENVYADKPQMQSLFLCGAYYLFLGLEELERRLGRPKVFELRRLAIRRTLGAHPMLGEAMLAAIENDYRQRTAFFFSMGDMIFGDADQAA